MNLDMAFSRQRGLAIVLAIVVVVLIPLANAFATQPWTPQRALEEFQRSHATEQPWLEPPVQHGRRSTLDDIAYFQHYRMLCDFLVSLQFTGAGTNHGGEIEAEAEQNIIETDNTQEAIREWSQWAIWTGDTATYGPHIRLAMDYLSRWPAWHEDQQGGFYYGAHNCGWGFEAAAKYRQAYNDTSWNWYADSCALWTVANNLAVDTISTALGQLDPLAEGLAIGGLYPHAVYRQRSDWHNFAVNKGRTLKRWFERNPARLNNNETWALCGGTALWGVCESFFAEYPDSGQAWVNQYGHQLRVWTSSGTWNHSANAWYCNAQWKCFELTNDSLYLTHAHFITDSLIGLDLDHDGGIPPGLSYPQTDDASWVSSYMGWMGMERIINGMPRHDVAARSFVSPNPLLPHLAGDSLLVAAHISNNGLGTQVVRAYATGRLYSDSVIVTLVAGQDSLIRFANPWVLPDDSTLGTTSPLTLRVSAPLDDDSTNDSLTVAFDIRRSSHVIVTCVDALGHPILEAVTIQFHHASYPDSLWATARTGANGATTSVKLMTGRNFIRAIPAISHVEGLDTVDLGVSQNPRAVTMTLASTDIALIDDSPGDTLETFYQSSLDSFHLNVRTWNEADSVVGGMVGIPRVIWFTGNATQNTLTVNEQSVMEDYVLYGGHLILTGQNIPDDSANYNFLHDVMHCTLRTANTNQHLAQGTANDSLFNGVNLYLIGQGGAQNQTNPASVNVLPGSTSILRYSGGGIETCGLEGTFMAGRYIFLSFGLEGASGINNSTTRNDFLARCFAYLDQTSYAEPKPAMPASLSLSQNYPNPFNPTTTISFVAPRGAKPVRLVIYNLLGQEVRTLYDGVGTGTSLRVMWDGTSSAGIPVSSGMYVYRLRAGNALLVHPLQLLR